MRSLLNVSIKLGSVAILLWIILSNADLAAIRGRMSEFSSRGVLCFMLVFALHVVLSALRWQAVTTHLGGNIDLRAALSGSLIERFVNQALPSFVGGDGARVLELVRSGHDARIAAYSVFVDRLLSFGGAFGLVVLFLPLSLYVSSGPVRDLLVMTAVLPVFAAAAIGLPPASFWSSLAGNRLMHYPVRLVLTLRSFLLEPKVAVVTVGLSLLLQALIVVCFVILSLDLRIELRIQDAAALVPLINLAPLVIPISLAGWGIREGAAVMLLSTAGISNSDAVALSLAFGGLWLAASCLGGLIWLIFQAVGRQGQVRRV
jgi:uncharacterized membrane protein YbhN (UPF0104 family)